MLIPLREGADFLLAVKGNQSALHQREKEAFEAHRNRHSNRDAV